MKTKYGYLLVIVFSAIVVVLGFNHFTNHGLVRITNSKTGQLGYLKVKTDPDKNLLTGEWSETGTPNLIKITGVDESGRLQIGFFNPKSITVLKSNWIKNGNLLSVYIELQDEKYMNSNFKLNYVPERDMLVGEFYDAMQDFTCPTEFAKIK